jgi:elongation factor P
MAMISVNELKRGQYILYQDSPHSVVDSQFVSPGKGSAFYRFRLKGLFTGRVVDFTYKSGEKVDEVNVETREAEYSYFDGENYVFIEPRSFEQFNVPAQIMGEDKAYLKEGILYRIKFYEENAVGVTLPKTIVAKVTYTEPSVKGDTVTNALKPATLDTGTIVQVPLFVNNGDELIINTESGTYVSRN